MQKYKVTKEMFSNLEYDPSDSVDSSPVNGEDNNQPTMKCAMFIFHQSDLNASSYIFAKSMENPFSPKAILTVFVQESCAENFKKKLMARMKPQKEEIAKKVESLDTIKKIKPNIICLPGETGINSPIVVCDFTHEYFRKDSGIATLHVFRTTKEAITLYHSEKSFPFKNATIWCENHAHAYELVSALPITNFFINCNDIPLLPIEKHIQNKQSVALFENSYHYESIIFPNGQHKNVVFPFGTIFAN